MSKSRKSVMLFVLLAAMAVACEAANATAPTVSAPVTVVKVEQRKTVQAPEIKLEARLEVPVTLPVGDAVKLKFTMINKMDASVYVLKWYTPLEGFGGEIFRVVRDGQVVPYTGPLAYRALPSPESYVLLGAGESVSAEVDLAVAYDFSKAGDYAIEFLSPRISHVARTEAEMARTMEELGQVLIPANRVGVNIGNSEMAPDSATAASPLWMK